MLVAVVFFCYRDTWLQFDYMIIKTTTTTTTTTNINILILMLLVYPSYNYNNGDNVIYFNWK